MRRFEFQAVTKLLSSYLQGSLYITQTMHTIVGEIRQVYKQNELNIKMFI